MQHLFLVQIGPVQSFIAAGRRTQDLYVGSRMLSQLASAGFRAAKDSSGFKPIFPVEIEVKNEKNRLPKGVPHRLAFISEQEPNALAQKVEDAIRDYWVTEYAGKVYDYLLRKGIGKGEWESTFKRQQENWLECYWVAVPYVKKEHNASFGQAAGAMAQRKLMRHFPQIEEPGRKCTLTGAQSALEIPWAKLKEEMYDEESIVLRENEHLGTLALIKRLARKANCDLGDHHQTIISTREIAGIDLNTLKQGRQVEGYFAVLHIDGDKMGTRLSELHELSEHQDFSRKLAQFSDVNVPEIIQAYGGANAQLVYAGGDDVLALLPLRTVLRCADELRKKFQEITQCTASAGIAITPYKFPLDAALDMARKAEEIAKENYGRNALFVTEAHGTGQMRRAGGSWSITDLVENLRHFFETDQLSGKLGYDLLTLSREMVGKVQSEARLAEVTRLLRRRTAENAGDKVKKEIENLAGPIVDFGDTLFQHLDIPNKNVMNWESMAHWTILARFLAQPIHGGGS